MRSLTMKSLLLAALVLVAPGMCAAATRCGGAWSAAPAGSWWWPAGTTVTVYALRGAFTTEEHEALRGAVSFWDSAMEGTGLRFVYGGESQGVSDLPGSVTAVRVRVLENGGHLAEIFPFYEPHSDRRLRWAIVRVDPRLTSPEQLRSVLAHELAHTLGLGDCPECGRGTTIMAVYRGVNKGNGLDYPSVCDVNSARSRYTVKGVGKAVREEVGK